MTPPESRPKRSRTPSHTETRARIGGWPLAVAIAVVLVFLFFVRDVLLPFVFAAAFAFIFTPAVVWLQRRSSMPRWLAALVIYILVLAALALFAYFALGPLLAEIASLFQTLPRHIEALITRFAGPIARIVGHPIEPAAITAAIFDEGKSLLRGGVALSVATYGVAGILSGILAIVLLGYFLVSGERVANGVFWLVPPEYRPEVHSMRRKILPLLRRYFVGLLVVVTYAAGIGWIGFSVLFNLPLAGLLAVVFGLLELVPLVGPAISLTLVVLTAIQQTSFFDIVGLIAFATGLRLSIDELLGPLVLGQAARLHPVVVIFCFLSGAMLFGILGLIMAVPVAASIKIVLRTYYAEPIADQQING